MTTKTFFALALSLLATLSHADSLLRPQGKAEALLPVDQAFQFEGTSKKGEAVSLNWTVAPGYYLYGHMLKVTVDAPAGAAAPALQVPKGEQKQDAEFGEVIIHRGVLTVPLTFAAKSPAPRTLRVRYQGCADLGVCYPPQTRIVAIK